MLIIVNKTKNVAKRISGSGGGGGKFFVVLAIFEATAAEYRSRCLKKFSSILGKLFYGEKMA